MRPAFSSNVRVSANGLVGTIKLTEFSVGRDIEERCTYTPLGIQL